MTGSESAPLRWPSLAAPPQASTRHRPAVVTDVTGAPPVVDLDDGLWGSPGGIREGRLRSVAASHVTAMLELATALTGDAPTAADAVEAVLVRVHGGPGPTVARPDLRLRRMVVRELRSPRRRWERHRRPDPARPPQALGRTRAGASAHEALLQDLSRLPWRHRVVLVLRYHQGLSDDEAGAVLADSPAVVRTRVARGLAALRATSPTAPAHVPGSQEDQ